MNHFMQMFEKLIQEESGQDLIEYALVGCMIGLGAVASMKTLTSSVANEFTAIGTTLSGSV